MNNVKTILLGLIVLFSTTVIISDAYATHDNTGDSWSKAEQKFYCDPSLDNLSVTSTVTKSMCAIVEDSAKDWNAVSGSTWSLTKSSSSAIDFKGVNKGTGSSIGEMKHFAVWGTIWTAHVEINTQKEFGDSKIDSNVYDIYTVIKHEMGHLPTMYHNAHSGDESTSVMRTGTEIGYTAQRDITSNDGTALGKKYS